MHPERKKQKPLEWQMPEKDWKAEALKFKTHRLTLAQRKERIAEKIANFQAGGDDDE